MLVTVVSSGTQRKRKELLYIQPFSILVDQRKIRSSGRLFYHGISVGCHDSLMQEQLVCRESSDASTLTRVFKIVFVRGGKNDERN